MPLGVHTHTLVPQLRDSSHTGFTPLIKCTSCSPCCNCFCNYIFAVICLLVSHQFDVKGFIRVSYPYRQTLLRQEDHLHAAIKIRSHSPPVAPTPPHCVNAVLILVHVVGYIDVITAFPHISHCHILFVTLLNWSFLALNLVENGFASFLFKR